ncbi:PEBP-like protein [Trametopsis cervina]|nr:PEBP-like protein [Trametopsis cervina]
MFYTPIILSFTLASFRLVAAQNSSALGFEAIEAHFQQSGLVPTFLPTFAPKALLTLSFSDVGVVQPGSPLSQAQVQPVPSLWLSSADSSVTTDGNYTLIMADAGPVGTDETKGQTRHWLVNGVTLSDATTLNVTTDSGTEITKYAGPAPPQGTGPHRYTILLYVQPSAFTAPQGLDTPDVGVSVFNVSDYVKTSNLGDLVAATYFTVENGQATASISATSAVNTATLSQPASSSGSSSGSSPSSSTSPTSGGNTSGALITVASLTKALMAGVVGVFLL